MSSAPHENLKTSFSDLQEEEIGEIVRAYLMDNPEVIIEAVNLYSVQQRMAEAERTKTEAAANLPQLLDASTSFVAGKNPAAAKVAIIEMYDYHCGYCKRAGGLMQDMVKKDADVKVVFRELPILREESGYAAEMALASRDQGKFLDFHFDLLASSGVLTKARVDEIARKHGLDVAKMNAEIDSGAIPGMIETNHMLAQKMGIDGTPAFIIASTNGAYIDTVIGFDKEALEAKIKEAKAAR
jgi:protein-disulfide isomerase